VNEEQLRRTSAIAGAGSFVLALLGCLVVVEPGIALLTALGAGVALGLGVFVAGSVTLLARPVAPPPPRPVAPSRIDVTVAEAAPPDAMAGPPNEGTAHLSPDDVVRAADLHQTIRLDEAQTDYVLPEFSPEELFRDREGIDEQFLKAGIGIEDSGTPSDNVTKAPEEQSPGA
jgi:hypothetical protein